MAARLVRLQAGRPTSTHPLDRPEYLIGRDPSADLSLDAPLVSRRHALLRDEEGRHSLADLASANGTTLNGVNVSEPVLLEAGDLIELGGEVTLRYEEGPGRRLGAAWVVGLLLVVAAAGAAYWVAGRSDPVMEKASALAAEGWAAYQAHDAETAKSKIRSAAGELFHAGRLDDVSRAEVMRVALERLSAELEGQPDLASVFRKSLAESRPTAVQQRHAPDGCRLDRVEADALPDCLQQRIEMVLVDLRQDPNSVPDDLHRQVGARLRREHGFLKRSFARGEQMDLVPKLEAALAAEHMPPKLHYLALIESGYQPTVVSPAKALGLWQFMPGTARQYGLRVGGGIDERRDIDKSTRAAARYLNDLAFEFGGDALLLAIASYNKGENGVRAALRKLDDPFSERSFWRLAQAGLLREETQLYVPRFLAAAVAGEAGLPRPEVLEEAGY